MLGAGAGLARRAVMGGLRFGLHAGNLLTLPDQLDNAAWTKGNATVTADATTAPDGSQNADRVVETAATGNHLVRQIRTMAPGAHTGLIYAKAGERGVLTAVFADNGATFRSAHFTLSGGGTAAAGTTGLAGSQSIVNVGGGWYLCTIRATVTTGGAASYIDFRLSDTASPANFGASYAGNTSNGLYLWRAQLVAGTI